MGTTMWYCRLLARDGRSESTVIVSGSRLDAEVAAIKESDALLPEGAPWRCVSISSVINQRVAVRFPPAAPLPPTSDELADGPTIGLA